MNKENVPQRKKKHDETFKTATGLLVHHARFQQQVKRKISGCKFFQL